jgi:hypothetical protein
VRDEVEKIALPPRNELPEDLLDDASDVQADDLET